MERYRQAKNATIAQGECSRERIESTLATILASDPFRTSSQCRELLQKIVTLTLTSEHECLKERVLGTTVFGRKPHYDTASDSIVRVRAADVRKRLAQFYQSEACLAGMVRIDIPTGAYLATFRMLHNVDPWAGTPIAEGQFAENSIKMPAVTSSEHRSPAPAQSEFVRWKAKSTGLPVVVSLFVAMTVTVVTWTFSQFNKHKPFEEFWAPAFASSKAITIYNAENRAYRLRCATQNDDPRVLALGMDKAPCKDGEKFAPAEMIPIQNQFITIGDGYATALLCGLFARSNKPYQLRFGSELSYIDLRYSPAVLIGAFNNGWTLETTKELKFFFSEYPSIRERGGQNRVWTLPHLSPDGETAEDYAIVSRVLSPDSGQILMSAAGITQYGTRAAGEFLTTREELEGALQRAPAGWSKHNVQFLIHTQVVRETPGRPTVVASYFW